MLAMHQAARHHRTCVTVTVLCATLLPATTPWPRFGGQYQPVVTPNMNAVIPWTQVSRRKAFSLVQRISSREQKRMKSMSGQRVKASRSCRMKASTHFANFTFESHALSPKSWTLKHAKCTICKWQARCGLPRRPSGGQILALFLARSVLSHETAARLPAPGSSRALSAAAAAAAIKTRTRILRLPGLTSWKACGWEPRARTVERWCCRTSLSRSTPKRCRTRPSATTSAYTTGEK